MLVRSHSTRRLPILFVFSLLAAAPAAHGATTLTTMEIFPYVREHVHGSTIAELPNGDLVAAWFQGSGERWADDVAIMGSRLKSGAEHWSEPFVMADTPEFPDINPILFTDRQGRLWLMWYTVIANQWETSLLKYRICNRPGQGEGAPVWDWQDVLHVKPGGRTERGIQPNDPFVRSVERQIAEYEDYLRASAPNETKATLMSTQWKLWGTRMLAKARGQDMMAKGVLVDDEGNRTEAQLGYPYFRRMGWQTKNKAIFTKSGRMIVPLYSDGFSFSLMALTDDGGKTWSFSEPLVGAGNIQPSVATKSDGTLVAYMRDNGPPPQRLHVSQSADDGQTWSLVKDSELPNPGSGADVVTLANGHWVLAYNDTEDGRHSLAVSLSTDGGQTWPYARHLERDMRDRQATRSHYPSIIQGRDGALHVVYSYHHNDRGSAPHKTIKYARFMEDWITVGKP
jgi:predicted neuraminidase